MGFFRANARNFSLTYPKCEIPKEELLEHLKTLFPIYICCAHEEHEDGSSHLHASIKFNTKKDIRNERFFDYKGHHCNIQTTKNIKAWTTYIQKDEDFVIFENVASTLTGRLLSDVPTVDLRNYCLQNRIPFGYYQEERNSRSHVSMNIEEETPVNGTMNMYLQCLIPNFDKTLVLIGPTGCGKTTWAKTHAPKPALFVTHMDTLKSFNPEIHHSLIFDDMTFQHLPTQAQIHLVDKEDPRSIHTRYVKIDLPANLVKIFTCNENPFQEHEAINRRIKFINI